MVKYEPDPLGRAFAALADPTRRAMIAQLYENESASVSEIAKRHPISLPAVMKHLDVLADAGFILRTKTGRTVTCLPNPEPMEEARRWLDQYQRFWTRSLDRLAQLVEEDR